MSEPVILVTRPESEDDRLAGQLKARGFRVLAVPTVATEPVERGGPLGEAARDLTRFDWVVVTSVEAVRALQAAVGSGTSLASNPPRWAAVGPATAAALRAAGVVVDATPATARGSAIPEAMAFVAPLAGTRVLLPRADAADATLPAGLRALGAEAMEVVAYHTIECPASSRDLLAVALGDPDLAAVVVASGSAVRGLVRMADEIGRGGCLGRLALISIGPSTSAESRRLGLEVAAEASTPTPESIADAVASAVSTNRPNPIALEVSEMSQ
jgi:uroporphyrinogen-III synthase